MGILSRRLQVVEKEMRQLQQAKKTEHSRNLIKRNHKIINNLKTWIREDEANIQFTVIDPTEAKEESNNALSYLLDELNTPEFINVDIDECKETYQVIANIMEGYKSKNQ